METRKSKTEDGDMRVESREGGETGEWRRGNGDGAREEERERKGSGRLGQKGRKEGRE